MPRFSTLALGLSLALPATALADSSTTSPVIGGHDAAAGKWPDIAGMVFDRGFGDPSLECTGTLIAPTLVITAGHCNGTDLKSAVVGSVSRSQVGEGEQIDIVERFPYPDWESTFDVTVVRLARASTKTPRTIATGWASFDIVDGAEVGLVGYGSIDEDGTQYIDALQEATSTITDADCSTTELGCNPGARPEGELGAGGDGIDTCPGDSGGPLYLVTDYGTFLAGVTSRGYNTATRACADGGIYSRPDAIVAWIEETTSVTLPRAPEPTADLLVAPGGNGSVTIAPNDPRPGTSHQFQILQEPTHGTATVDDTGRVTYDGETGYLGEDSLQVRVIDAADPQRALAVRIAVDVVEGDDGGGCGCRTGAGSPGALAPVALAGLALLRRRRRAAL